MKRIEITKVKNALCPLLYLTLLSVVFFSQSCKCINVASDSTPPSVLLTVEYKLNDQLNSINVGQAGQPYEIDADPNSINVLYSGTDPGGVVYLTLLGSITIYANNQIQQGTLGFDPIQSSNCPRFTLVGTEDLTDIDRGKVVFHVKARNAFGLERQSDPITINIQ